MDYRKLLKNFILTVVMILAVMAAIVIIFDPFFHYHKPLFGLKEVLTDKEYQCIGTLKNFEYDSVLVGSSVCENYNNHWFDEKFGIKTVKAVRSYGATADLTYFLDVAYSNNNIKKVFYNIDPGALAGEPYVTFEETGCPMYLYDDNPFNDIEYLFNKDVILEKIPYMLSKSYMGEYDEGNSYNWAQWKQFGAQMMLEQYIRHSVVEPMKDKEYYSHECDANIALLENVVKAHPETEFYFFYPPYSFLWWDNIYRYGDSDAYICNMKRCAQALCTYDNVTFYSFIADDFVCSDLDNYMDVLHFSQDINYYVVDNLGEEKFSITADNIDDRFGEMKTYADKAVNELIKPFEADIKIDE